MSLNHRNPRCSGVSYRSSFKGSSGQASTDSAFPQRKSSARRSIHETDDGSRNSIDPRTSASIALHQLNPQIYHDGSQHTFERTVKAKAWAKLEKLDHDLNSLGYGTNFRRECGIEQGPIANQHELLAIETMISTITQIVNFLKPSCRTDERLYAICGELIHVKIQLCTVPFDEWLTSETLELRDDIIEAIRNHRNLVEASILRFEMGKYRDIECLGLQSALKYDEMYLTDLKHGKKESLGQFFARIASAAATECVATPQMAAVLTSSTPNWGTAFEAFFWALAHQTFVPATPCMLYTGRKNRSTASCYLLNPKCNSVDSAVVTIANEVVPLVRARGGLGISLNDVNGPTGIVPVMKLLDSLIAATSIDSVRATGICVYIEAWHADVLSAISMRGILATDESRRCDNVYLALWVPDLLFKRYERYLGGDTNVTWTLFSGSSCGRLADLHGDLFEREYKQLESDRKGTTTVHIKDFMYAIIKSAVATGTPFILFKDAFNRHFHSDTQGDPIACSNLCTEIVHKSGPGENGVCNLASVNLAQFVKRTDSVEGENIKFDFKSLRSAVRVATIFANTVCASGEKPTEATSKGADRYRTIGIGMQGLHTVFLKMGLDMESSEARDLNQRISELMLLESMTVSCELCENGLEPFQDFATSAYSTGWMHFDGWDNVTLSEAEEWESLRGRVAASGLYNSQFIALMPTAACAQVTEVSESFYPLFSNLFSKVTNSGELPRPNQLLMKELRTIYANDEKARLMAINALENNGWSVAAALGDKPECSSLLKYKNAFEIDQKILIDMCRDRAPFVDHSQSMTLYIKESVDGKIQASRVMNLLLHAYRQGLKTGMYYCKIQKVTNNGIFMGAGELVCSACIL